jgi:hypothetical protein
VRSIILHFAWRLRPIGSLQAGCWHFRCTPDSVAKVAEEKLWKWKLATIEPDHRQRRPRAPRAAKRPRRREAYEIASPLRVTAAEGVRAGVFEGLGLVIASEWILTPELKSGVVKSVLGDWQLPRVDLWAVFPTGRQPNAKARAFISHIEKQISKVKTGHSKVHNPGTRSLRREAGGPSPDIYRPRFCGTDLPGEGPFSFGNGCQAIEIAGACFGHFPNAR